MKENRQKQILEFINRREYVPFSELCEYFHVSNATMRRDLVEMDRKHLIRREHGGARCLFRDQDPTTIQTRLALSNQEKTLIAQRAFQFIDDNDSIILDASSTCLKIAEIVARSPLHLTIVTNYFEIASLLKDSPKIDLLFLGGFVRKQFNSTTGTFAEMMVDNLQADIAFIGCDSISLEKGAANNKMDVVDLKKKFIQNSNTSSCVCDNSKFTKNAMFPFAEINEFKAIITDENIELPTVQAFQDHEVPLIIARQ